MITQDQIKDLQERVETLHQCLAIESKRAEVKEKEQRSQAPDFWDDPKQAETFLKGLSGVKAWVSAYDGARSAVEDLEASPTKASAMAASPRECSSSTATKTSAAPHSRSIWSRARNICAMPTAA